MARKRFIILGLAVLLLSASPYRGVADSIFDPVLNPLRDYLVKTVTWYISKSLNGTLEVGALRGSLLSAPVLQHIVLRDAQGTVVGQVDEVRLSYDLTSLLKKRLTIHEMTIVRPQLTLIQEPDGQSNFGRLLSPPQRERPEAAPEPTAQEPPSGSGLPFGIVLERLELHEGQIALQLPALPGVQTVAGLQVRLSAQIDQEGIRAQLRQFTAHATPADVQVQSLQGGVRALAGVVQIDDLRLQTGETLVTLAGVLPGSKQPASFELQVQPLDMAEIGRLLHNDALRGQLRVALKAEGPPEALVVSSQLSAGDGKVTVQGQVNTVATPVRYRSQLDITHLDLTALLERAALQSDMNVHIRLEGQGLSPQELRGEMQLELQPSHLGSIALRPSQIHLEAQRERFQVRRFHLDTSVARMTARGALDFAGTSDLQYELDANLAALQQLLNMTALDGSVRVQGQASGEWPALNARGMLDARNLRYQDHRMHALQLTYAGAHLGSTPELTAQLLAQHLRTGTLPVAELRVDAAYRGAERQLHFTTGVVQSADHGVAAKGLLTLQDAAQQVVVEELAIRLPDRTWQAKVPLQVAHANGRIHVQQMQLVHADESVEFSGAVDGEQLQDMRLQVSQIDLSYLRRLLNLPDLVGGRASLQIQLGGTLGDPLLQGELVLQDASQRHLPFERLSTTLTYHQRQLRSEMHLLQKQGEILKFDLRLPVDMAFTALPLEQRLVDAPIEVQLHLKDPNLAAFQRWQPALPKLAGTLRGKVGLRGTYAVLALNGDLQLERLGMEGAAEQVTGPIHLAAQIVAASTVTEVVRALPLGQLTPKVQNLVLRVPRVQGRVPNQEGVPQPFTVRDFLLQAEGQWSATGLHATLQTLQLQAQGFGLPATNLNVAARWTPAHVELTRLQVRLPQSEVHGQGRLTMPEQQLQLRVEIPRLRLDEFPITLPSALPTLVRGGVSIDGTLQAPRVEVRLQYAGAEIAADLAAQLQEALPRYQTTLRVQGLDVAQVLPDGQGRLQVNLQLQGAGFAGEQRRATLDLRVESDGFTLVPGLKMQAQASLAGEAIQLENFRVSSAPVELVSQGTLSAARQLALTYSLTLGDLASLQKQLGAELQAKGGLRGEVQGPLDALQARGVLQLEPFRFAQVRGQRLQAEFAAARLPTAPQANIRAQIIGVQGPALEASSLRLEGDYASQQGTFSVAVTEGPYQQTMLAGDVVLAEGLRLALQRLRIQYQNLRWENEGPIQVVRSPQGELQLDQLRLRSGSQALSVRARLAPEGAMRAEVELQQLQLGPTMRVVMPGAEMPDGQLSLALNVEGTLQQPQMQGNLQLTSLTWQQQPLGEMHADLGLTDNTLRTDLRWQDRGRELLQVRGTVGLGPEGALGLQVQAPELDLTMLEPLSPAVTQSAGKLRLDLQVLGTLQQPQARGSLELHDGVLQLAATGEAYSDIQARLIFAGERVDIERLHVGSRSGPLELLGRIESAGMTLRQITLSIQAQDFTAMYTPTMEALISTDMTVQGSLQNLAAMGSVTVPRARVVLDTIPGTGPQDVQPWELTVKGVYGPGPEAVATTEDASSTRQGREAPLSFLRTDLRINLPRNVWVQAPGTAIEVGGAIRVTKELEQPFVVSGSIATVRGFAGFYGKKFVLDKGNVTFTGAEEIDPLLDVTATHKVSTYLVSVHVEGKAKQPQISLSSTPELPQADIVSLLLIGKTTDRLTSSEQNLLSKQAQQLAGNIIAGQLEETFGKSLGLDTIEITAGEQLGQGSISVGRYVTQDIFLSYERELGQEGANTVGIEYSINPRLKLKGSSRDTGESAVDFLWRLDY